MLDEDIQQSLDERIGFVQLFLKHGAADKDDRRAFFGPGPRHPGFGIDQRHFAENAPFADRPQHLFHAIDSLENFHFARLDDVGNVSIIPFFEDSVPDLVCLALEY